MLICEKVFNFIDIYFDNTYNSCKLGKFCKDLEGFMKKRVLLTGGAGYIGSHTAVELLDRGYNVIIYDNLSNASKIAIDRVEEITGKKVKFYKADILDTEFLKKVLIDEKIDLVIHFAALKAVGESVRNPLKYYHNNLTGTCLLYTSPSPRD